MWGRGWPRAGRHRAVSLGQYGTVYSTDSDHGECGKDRTEDDHGVGESGCGRV